MPAKKLAQKKPHNMAKRARTSGGSVTGGTGDVKPQILTLATDVMSADAVYVTQQIALPVPRFGTMKTKATIFEILWVDWYPITRNVADAGFTVGAFLSTITTRETDDVFSTASNAADILDPRNFANVSVTGIAATTIFAYPIRIDLTDSNGNGMLIATDKIVISGGGVGVATTGRAVCKMAYRLVNVGITEYVGIVQSQQGS